MSNMLYHGDNVSIIHSFIRDNEIDLIYLDPPFHSAGSYEIIASEESENDSSSQIPAFHDTWEWGTAEAVYYRLIAATSPHISKMLSALHTSLGKTKLFTHIVMMTERLIELHRVLKPTGSLFLHCNSTTSHYLKIVLDAIFGVSNFRNEIIWQHQSKQNNARTKFPDVSDTILFYAKSSATKFHPMYAPHDPIYVKTNYRFDDNDRRGPYRLGDITSPSLRPHLMYEWQGFPYPPNGWRYQLDTMQKLHNEGRIYYPRLADGSYDTSKRPFLKRYLNEQPGSIITNVWTDIHPIHEDSIEHIAYITQKPLALLQRIILVASQPGDLCLDPFAGCGTMVVAAQALERQWIGIDTSFAAILLIKNRMQALFGDPQITIVGTPENDHEARILARENAYEFQQWALSLVAALPVHINSGLRKQDEENNINGVIYFKDNGTGSNQRVWVQVKSERVERSDIFSFSDTVERNHAVIGVLITLNEPDRDVIAEAAAKGSYHSKGLNQKFPRLQIITVADLIKGTQIQMPSQTYTSDQAQSFKPKQTNEPLFLDDPDETIGQAPPTTQFFSIAEAAARLNVPLATVRDWCIKGKMPGAIRAGRAWQIPESTLSEFKSPKMGRPRRTNNL